MKKIYQKRYLLLILCIVVLSASTFAQNLQKISGKVTDQKGDALIGASITIKNTTKGTTTDANGNYSIEVAKGTVLQFSFIGYVTKGLTVGDLTTINVTLDESKDVLGEVVVTAENRSVSAQSVPITLDLVTAKEIQRQGITDLVQIQNAAPGLNIIQNLAFNQINIRGVGSNDGISELSDQAVTLSIDGEYINRPLALNAAIFDIDRVEVLKGPQGTLYGRNASAGAINIIAKKPTTDKTTLDFGGSYGSYNSLKLNGAVNLPLGKIAALRVAGLLNKNDGYRDGGPAGRIDNANVWGTRVGLAINPTNAFSIYVAGEYNKTDQGAPQQYGVPLDETWKGKAPINFTTNLPKDFPVATTGFLKIGQLAFRGRAAYDFGSTRLTYTAGYRDIDMTNYNPLNGFVPETFSFDNALKYQTQSHEFRLNGESKSFIWQGGVFWGTEQNDGAVGLAFPAVKDLFGGVPYLSHGQRLINSKTAGIFGQATYNVSEKFSITGGLRFTKDTKSRSGADLTSIPFVPGAVVFFYPNRPTTYTQKGVTAVKDSTASWSQATWLGNLEYKVDKNKLLFAKVSTGYKAGGFDNVGPYDPEYVTSYEIGSKNKFAGGNLRLNASIFHYDYTNQQVSVFINTSLGSHLTNAGSTKINGIELDGEWAATKADRFRFTINYLDAVFKSFSAARNRANLSPEYVDLKGNIPPQSPKWTIVGGYDHDFSLGNAGSINAGIRTMFKSDYYLTAVNFLMDKQPAYTRTDININYKPKNGKWDAGFFVQNLEDKRIIVYSSFIGDNVNIYNWIFGAPRVMGFNFNLHFK